MDSPDPPPAPDSPESLAVHSTPRMQGVMYSLSVTVKVATPLPVPVAVPDSVSEGMTVPDRVGWVDREWVRGSSSVEVGLPVALQVGV